MLRLTCWMFGSVLFGQGSLCFFLFHIIHLNKFYQPESHVIQFCDSFPLSFLYLSTSDDYSYFTFVARWQMEFVHASSLNSVYLIVVNHGMEIAHCSCLVLANLVIGFGI